MKPRRLISLVTDRRRLSPGLPTGAAIDRLVELVAAAAHAGVDIIQVREPDLPTRDLVVLTQRCVEQAHRSQVLVNDRLDVAIAARAHGVHLRSDSIDAAAARALAPPNFLIGRSVHGAAEATEAGAAGADYLMFGTTFATVSKPPNHPVSGLDALGRACAATPAPVLAIGGITVERIGTVMRSGAAGVAAIGLFIPPVGESFQRHVDAVVASARRAFETPGTGAGQS